MTITSQKLFTNCRIGPRVSGITTVPACVAPPGSREVIPRCRRIPPPLHPPARAAGPPRPLPLPLRRALLPRCRAPRRPSRPATSPASPCAATSSARASPSSAPSRPGRRPTSTSSCRRSTGPPRPTSAARRQLRRAQVLGNVNIATAGSYTFRLTSDDGSELIIDDTIVIDHDGLHGATAKDGTVTLTAGLPRAAHRLLRGRRRPAAHAGVEDARRRRVRGRARPRCSAPTPASCASPRPGASSARAPSDSPGDGLPLTAVHPGYTLTNLRPDGFEPQVTGMDWLPDGRLVSHLGRQRQRPGHVAARRGLHPRAASSGADSTARRHVHQDRRAASRSRWASRSSTARSTSPRRHGLTELVDTNGDEVADQYADRRDLAVRRQLPRVRASACSTRTATST